jgi:hypothetical protein
MVKPAPALTFVETPDWSDMALAFPAGTLAAGIPFELGAW